MIVATFVTAYLLIGAICAVVLVCAHFVSGPTKEDWENVNSPLPQDAHPIAASEAARP
jgi:hypothetical protein